MFEKYKVDEIPAMKLNDVEIYKFEITEAQAKIDQMRSCFKPGSIATVAGNYTGLQEKNILWMTDTRQEIKMHSWLFNKIHEDTTVLITGLGLGVALKGAFLNGAAHVTIIEKNQTIIELTGKFWKEIYGDKLTIINADAYTWKPPKGQRWDVIWHDIWKEICSDNTPLMTKLHRKYGRRTHQQNSWGLRELGRRR